MRTNAANSEQGRKAEENRHRNAGHDRLQARAPRPREIEREREIWSQQAWKHAFRSRAEEKAADRTSTRSDTRSARFLKAPRAPSRSRLLVQGPSLRLNAQRSACRRRRGRDGRRRCFRSRPGAQKARSRASPHRRSAPPPARESSTRAGALSHRASGPPRRLQCAAHVLFSVRTARLGTFEMFGLVTGKNPNISRGAGPLLLVEQEKPSFAGLSVCARVDSNHHGP